MLVLRNCIFSIVLFSSVFILQTTIAFRISDSEQDSARIHNEWIRSLMKPEIDPCENFMEYSCGNYHKLVQNKPSEKRALDINTDWIINNKLQDTPIERKTRLFYETCLKDLKKSKLENLHSNVETWPATEDNWNSSIFKWTSRMMEYTENIDQHWTVLYVTAGRPDLLERLIIPGYDLNKVLEKPIEEKESETIEQAMITSGLNVEDSKILTHEIIEFSMTLISEMRNCPSSNEWYEETTLKELQNEFPLVDWTYAFEKDEITPDTKIILLDQARSKKYIKIISENQRLAYNYLIWLTAKRNVLSTCQAKTMKYFGSVILKKAADEVITSKSENYFKKNIENTIRIVQEYIKKEDIEDKDSLEKSIKRLNVTGQSLFNIISTELDIQKLENMYKDVEIDTSNFTNNFEILKSFDIDSLSDENKCKEPECLDLRTIDLLLRLIAGGRNTPFYATYSIQLPGMLLENVNESRKKSISSTLIKQIDDCYADFNKAERPFWWRFFGSGSEILLSIALKLSYEEYDNYIDDSGLYDILDNIDLTPSKAFFINFAQAACETYTAAQLSIIKVLSNLNIFTNAFECPVGSPMNPENNCFKI